jgi:phosphatidylglycerophosphatase A
VDESNEPGPSVHPARRMPLVWMLVATFFGAGLSPKAPGTVGSVASLVLWAPVVLLDLHWGVRLALALGIFLIGIPAASSAVAVGGKQDPQHVVVDEVAGMGMTLVLASPHWTSVVVGLLAFRLCDIWKPWPISVADEKLKGGFGAMADDLLAGMLALVLVELAEAYVMPMVLG